MLMQCVSTTRLFPYPLALLTTGRSHGNGVYKNDNGLGGAHFAQTDNGTNDIDMVKQRAD